nr:hypothetical protein [Morganella morganii]
MSHQSGHNNEKSGAPGEISRRRFIQVSSVLSAVPFLASESIATAPSDPAHIPVHQADDVCHRDRKSS